MNRINAHREEARALVEKLHITADTFESAAKRHLDAGFNHIGQAIYLATKDAGESARINRMAKSEGEAAKQAIQMMNLMRDAAVLLDDYQSGFALATPHPSTGCLLLPTMTVEAEEGTC